MWRLKSKTEIDEETGNPLYWSNELGWVTKEDSELFFNIEREEFDNRAEIMDAVWEKN